MSPSSPGQLSSDAGACSIGRLNRNAIPPEATRSAHASPPWRRTIARQMASPRPTPPAVVSIGRDEILEDPLDVDV